VITTKQTGETLATCVKTIIEELSQGSIVIMLVDKTLTAEHIYGLGGHLKLILREVIHENSIA
jgi:hypothetical protein